MTAHAFLSASGSKRWMECPPSAMLEKQFKDVQSAYAAEGSFAHSLAELHLNLYLENISKHKFNSEWNKLQQNEFFSQEMIDYVDVYVGFAIERINAARARTKDAVIQIEQRLDYSPWVPNGFGTGDLITIADEIMEIADLKYGKGVPVSALDNPQMKLYALGAINQFNLLYDFQIVRMTIVQPRLDSISIAELSVKELLDWAENTVKPLAAMAIKGEGEFKAGNHCQFCKARFTCRARADKNLELAKLDFQDPPLLTIDEIAEVLAKAEELQKWAKDVSDYALDQAVNHDVKFPGWKLVEGRSKRVYSDEKEVANVLLAANYAEDIIYKPKELVGITAMEKALGKKKFGILLDGLIIKPAGKPVLVPESDKRPEICSTDSAKADFAEQIRSNRSAQN
ncbi:conserved hypothetical protein [Desulforamulus reducens MI-1]|uniref:DUF2800 domain-containing protein n=1 Tax=Desulforamulus reducens (strain ATCC BAA-1160 / DSM 100696 / MI-1) TaxID=349161 RepID=A4J3R9_DESRM|nr:DUF2800 domain-containing protein [Desulforamulus reducens]ABO49722.1 conserved hypothetical protein [Desulforamulus reducens MI-1]